MSRPPPIPPAQRERHDPHPDAAHPDAGAAVRGAAGAHPKAGEEANRRDNLVYERKVQDR